MSSEETRVCKDGLLKISREKKCGTIARRLKVIRGATQRGVPGHDGETYNAKTIGESVGQTRGIVHERDLERQSLQTFNSFKVEPRIDKEGTVVQ